MRSLRALLIFLAVVFLGAALLAPWVYWGMQTLAAHAPFLQGTAAQPFHRYVNRCVYVLALVGLWPLLRALQAREWAAVGLVSPSGQGGRFLFGFGLGFLSLLLVAVGGLASGARVLNHDLELGLVLRSAGIALFSAMTVSVLEELLFRGVLYGRLRPATGEMTALLLSAGIYSIVHFFQRPPPPVVIHAASGFETLGQMLRGFADMQALFPGFLTLLVGGIVLAWLYQVSGTLYASMGLHAGWIFWLKLYGAATREAPGAPFWLWGSGKLIDGWSALLGMCFCAVVVRGYARNRGTQV